MPIWRPSIYCEYCTQYIDIRIEKHCSLVWLSPAGGGEGRVPAEWWAVAGRAAVMPWHAIPPHHHSQDTAAVCQPFSTSFWRSLTITTLQPPCYQMDNLSSGSGSDSAANSSTEWLVLGIFSCSSDLAEGLAICPHLSLNFNVQTVSGCCPGPGRWRRWRCVTGGERRHAWLPSPPPAPLETGALQVSQYSREPIQRRCLIAPA